MAIGVVIQSLHVSSEDSCILHPELKASGVCLVLHVSNIMIVYVSILELSLVSVCM